MRPRAPLFLLALLLAACSEPDFYGFSSTPRTGTVHPRGGLTAFAVFISDSPLDEAESVRVVVDRLQLRGNRTTTELLAASRTLDLLALQNGVRALLAERDVAPGTYRLRLVLAPAGHAVDGAPLLADGAREIDFEPALRLEAGGRLELQIDLNARLSVVRAAGAWRLRPAATLVDPRRAGFVEGAVDAPGAIVSVQRAGEELASARVRADGSYRLGPLPPGRYDLVVTAPGREPAFDEVEVRDGDVSGGRAFHLDRAPFGRLEGRADPGALVHVFRDGHFVALLGADATGRFHADLPAGAYDVRTGDTALRLTVAAR